MTPIEVSAVDMAFPADVSKLMPDLKAIPPNWEHENQVWIKLQQDWFFSGLKGASFEANEGINASKA